MQGLLLIEPRLPLVHQRSAAQFTQGQVLGCADETAAGASQGILASDATALLHEGTAGRLRDVDRVATACLRHAARGGQRIVDRPIITHVLTADQVR